MGLLVIVMDLKPSGQFLMWIPSFTVFSPLLVALTPKNRQHIFVAGIAGAVTIVVSP